jgi:hypothetical protein
MICGSLWPEGAGIKCIQAIPNHASCAGYDPSIKGMRVWDNPGYIAPRPAIPQERRMSTLAAMHANTEPEARVSPLLAAGVTDTQVAAALAVAPQVGTQRRQVLEVVITSGGATDEEIQGFTGLHYNSEGPRRRELHAGGWIEDSGFRRKNKSGSDSIVWVLTEKGWKELQGND